MSELTTLFLPDQSSKQFSKPPTALEVAQSIGSRLAQDTVGVCLNGESSILDLRNQIPDGSRIEIVTLNNIRAIEVIRHSAAHIMAQAVQSLWPEVKVTIGPVIENGFYYDFDSPRSFTDEDFPLIEKKMMEIVQQNLPITREEWSAEKAISVFNEKKEAFKVEIIQELTLKSPQEPITIYRQGEWFDLCRGPHIQRTGQLKAFKLLSVAGAYWRGDEKKPMLQRIYATAFAHQKDLDVYLNQIEEAKKRDHRRIGKELGLFQFHPWAPGSPFFTGKGTVVYNELQKYLRELYLQFGYQEVITPQIFDLELFKTSGHLANYKENMYFIQRFSDEISDFGMKPMNCPSHCLMFAAEKHSYRELPYRIADFGRLHRFEKSGTMHGLSRVRSFCQDDAHIFCSMEQLSSEISLFMKLLDQIYKTLEMSNYKVYLSTRPEKRIGADEVWDRSEKALTEALKNLSIPFEINPGDGAFYGPKLDIVFTDAIGRPWQLGTIQCDFNSPQNFELKYVGEDNQEHRPVMLHRAILGSFERFIGVYIEHTSGHLPPWLSPVQAIILNVTDRVSEYCLNLENRLKSFFVRAEFDQRKEKLNYKIREAQMQKIPYMLIVGDREAEKQQVSIRLRGGQVFQEVPLSQMESIILSDLKSRRMNDYGKF